MLKYFRTKKIKELLIRNYELSLEIDKEIEVLTTKSDEISVLELQDRVLAAEKVAFVYDELKKQYPDFTTIRSGKDVWKVNKPRLSEGLVFILQDFDYKFQHQLLEVTDRSWYTDWHFDNKFRYLKETCAAPLLIDAMRINEENLLEQRANKLFPSAWISSEMKIAAVCMYEYMKGYNTPVSLGGPHYIIDSLVAKVAKTNLVK